MHETSFAFTRRAHQRPSSPGTRPRATGVEGLPRLEGRLVTLRELEPADGAHLLAVLATPEVMRFLSPPPQSLERFTGFIETTRIERHAGRYAGFAMVPHGIDHPVGVVQIRQLEPNFRTAEWGIALGAEWWGRGLFLDAGEAGARVRVQRGSASSASRRGWLPATRAGIARSRSSARWPRACCASSLLVADGTRHDQVLWSWLGDEWRRAREAAAEGQSWVH